MASSIANYPSVGDGFFNDTNPITIPVGQDPGPVFVGPFLNGGPDLVTVNAGSNSVTVVSDFLGSSPVTQTIASGGVDPHRRPRGCGGRGF